MEIVVVSQGKSRINQEMLKVVCERYGAELTFVEKGNGGVLDANGERIDIVALMKEEFPIRIPEILNVDNRESNFDMVTTEPFPDKKFGKVHPGGKVRGKRRRNNAY